MDSYISILHSPRSTPKKFLSYWSASTLPETRIGILALGGGTSVLWTSCNVDKWRVLLSSFHILQYSKAPSNLCHTNLHKYIYIYINILHLIISFIHFNTKQTKTMYSTHISYIILYNIYLLKYIIITYTSTSSSSKNNKGMFPFKKGYHFKVGSVGYPKPSLDIPGLRGTSDQGDRGGAASLALAVKSPWPRLGGPIFSSQLLKKRSKNDTTVLFGGKDFFVEDVLIFCWGVFTFWNLLGWFLEFFFWWGFLGRPVKSFCLGGPIFLRIYRRYFLFLYENKYIISPKKWLHHHSNMAVIFDGSTYGSQKCPHFFQLIFVLYLSGGEKPGKPPNLRERKHEGKSDHLPSRELTYCST